MSVPAAPVQAAETQAPVGEAPSAAAAREAVRFYREGRIDEARAIWEELAAAGDARALYNLATLYLEGRGGLPRDRAQALSLLERAAAAGEPMAAYRLAVLLLAEDGADERTRITALRHLTAAARAGVAPAQYRLALAYWEGDLLARDRVAAYLWMARAASHLRLAEQALRQMEAAMAPGELARAKARLGGETGTAGAQAEAGAPAPYYLQLIALRSRAAIEAYRRRLEEEAPDLVNDPGLRILPPETAARSFYRLQLGPFPTPAAARRRCTALRAAGFDCLLVKAGDAQ